MRPSRTSRVTRPARPRRGRCTRSAPRRRPAPPPGTSRCAAGCDPACGRARCRRCRWRATPSRPRRHRRVSAKSMVPTTADRCAGSVTNGVAYVGLVGPGVEPAARLGGALGRPGQAALAVEPVELLGEQEQGRQRRGVVGLVEPRVVDRDLQVAERGHPATGGRAPRRPARSPPATSAPATGRRRWRTTSAERSSRRRSRSRRRAGRRRRTSRRPAPARRRRHRPVRRSGIATPVEVSLWVSA